MIDDFIQSNKDNQANIGFYSYVSGFVQNALDLGAQDEKGFIYFNKYVVSVEWGNLYPTIIAISNRH